MNSVVKNQLDKCNIANIPNYNDEDNVILIKKKTDIIFFVGKCYEIELDTCIANPPPNFTLHQQWNDGTPPKTNHFNVEVLNIVGKMIKINGVGFGEYSSYMWNGWVPKDNIKVLREL